MQQQLITADPNMKKCIVCDKLGIFQIIEKLPKSGLAVGCFHADGSVHRWATFTSMSAVLSKNKRKSGADPRIINCPNCHKRGRVNDYHTDSQRPDLISYVVVHGKIRGKWGTKKGHKVSKRNRCYITNKEHRDIILKKLGRYIQQGNVKND
jgi:hypothetical protein